LNFNLIYDRFLAGKHIFIEKPISTTLEEADKLVEAVNESGVKFQFVCIQVSIVPFQVKPDERPDGHVIWHDFDKEEL